VWKQEVFLSDVFNRWVDIWRNTWPDRFSREYIQSGDYFYI